MVIGWIELIRLTQARREGCFLDPITKHLYAFKLIVNLFAIMLDIYLLMKNTFMILALF